MKRCQRTSLLIALLIPVITGGALVQAGDEEVREPPRVCKPVLDSVPVVEMGDAGVFTWTCSGAEKQSAGYYIVFVRPSGTYVLLKVPRGRTSYEFTPDTGGMWRWIVINTDPDPTKPDVESEPGYFQVIIRDDSIR